jgi:hypothetical protein
VRIVQPRIECGGVLPSQDASEFQGQLSHSGEGRCLLLSEEL